MGVSDEEEQWWRRSSDGAAMAMKGEEEQWWRKEWCWRSNNGNEGREFFYFLFLWSMSEGVVMEQQFQVKDSELKGIDP